MKIESGFKIFVISWLVILSLFVIDAVNENAQQFNVLQAQTNFDDKITNKVSSLTQNQEGFIKNQESITSILSNVQDVLRHIPGVKEYVSN